MSAIKKGYKQTKVGIIPEDWEVVNFNELKDKTDSHSITGGPFGSDLKSEHYTTSGVRVIQLQNIGDGKFINKEFVYTSEEKANQLKNCLIYPNEIILAKMAEPVARACLIPSFEDKFLMCSDGIRLLVDKNRFSTKYILEYINYDLFRKIAIDRSTGSTRGRIGLSDLKTIPLSLPPLKEQEKIADILITWNEAVDKQEKLIEAKELQKKALMQKLLSGEVRFSGFTNEWKDIKLGEIIKEINFKTTMSNQYEVLSVTKNGIYSQQEHFNKQIASEDNTGYKIVKYGNLVFSSMNLWMGSLDILRNYNIGIVSPAYKVFDIDYTKFDIDFIQHYLKSHYMIWLYNMNSEQGASIVRRNLDLNSLLTTKVKIPSFEEQSKIGEVLNISDNELNLLKKELEELKLQKKALMQKLLTGEVRVKV